MSVKLTKKFFMSIPAGKFLMSNIMVSRTESIFAEKVADLRHAKEQQWADIVKSRAAQVLCHVFDSELGVDAFFDSVSTV